jgi:hypothetical protein
MMATYTYQKPVKITADGDDEKYFEDHLTHIFNVIGYKTINSFSQADKERYFKMVTEHEIVISKLYGNTFQNSVIFLPVALREGVDNNLIEEYKVWLDKK